MNTNYTLGGFQGLTQIFFTVNIFKCTKNYVKLK